MDRIRSLLVPTDFSSASRAAGLRAASLAAPDGAALHLLHVLHFPPLAPPYDVSVPAAVWEGVRQGAEAKLEEEREALEAQAGAAKVTGELADTGETAESIARAADAHEADLIVMGTHGRSGISRLLLGSVAERTLRTAARPVLAVREETANASRPIRKILLAVDYSAHSDRAAELAAGLAARLGASVDVVHAFDLPVEYVPYTSPEGMALEEAIRARAGERLEAIRRKLEETSVQATVHARRGHASAVIGELAEEVGCDLIVMGTRGDSGLSHALLGSVAERTLRTAPCSVLVSPAPDGEAEGCAAPRRRRRARAGAAGDGGARPAPGWPGPRPPAPARAPPERPRSPA